ncbi:MAG: ribosome small subunit-dependent GTPase A [Armatimonadetes bacterium]|nr:ribosome small subunit-dependent GTPase A [Armatimonadota bacterium]
MEELELTLEDLGFDDEFADRFGAYASEGYRPGRISLEHKNLYTVLTGNDEMMAFPTGRMYYDALGREDLPVVGDWVAARIFDEQPPKAVIHAILPRRSKFSRKQAGKRIAEQPLAANIDTVFVVIGLDGDYSVRRVERYLTLAWESGAEPVVLLTKSDLCPEVEERLAEVEASAPGVPVHALSVIEQQGLEQLPRYLVRGKTVALLGSSGVGKSTILNHLLGKEVQRTQEVREDDSRGRHTTTHRQMFVLPSGGLVIDTPGMRELQLWNAEGGLADAFSDISALAEGCRFADCRHENEPGCRVQEALSTGVLSEGRFESYRKLRKELSYLERKQDVEAAQIEKEKWKKIHKQIRQMEKK